MAEHAHQDTQEVVLNLVQELAKKGEVPEKFILKDGFLEAIDAPDELWRDSLLIDLSLLSSSMPAARAELEKLRSALSQWGCFYVINHVIESSFLEELIEVTKQFFAIPLEDKLKCSASDEVFQGYGSDSAVLGVWNDRLSLTIHPQESRKLHLWPQNPEKLREMLDEYSKRLATMREVLYKGMARSLDLEEDCFLNDQGKDGRILVRLNFYPPCPCPERVLGSRPHSDGSTMTILLTEKEILGLQVFKDDQWYKVPVIPGALFINVGDMGEVMTNGIFKSMIHRVVTNHTRERVSVAAFYDSREKKYIGPVSELVNDHRPLLYKKLAISEYKHIFYEALAQGRMPLDAIKL